MCCPYNQIQTFITHTWDYFYSQTFAFAETDNGV